MKSVNKVILVGNVTRDAEVKAISGSKSVCSFGIATNRVWKDANGDKQSLPEYHSVISWGGRRISLASTSRKASRSTLRVT